ncbi:unnamed protein product, partial [Symbiodinium sp. KB8]
RWHSELGVRRAWRRSAAACVQEPILGRRHPLVRFREERQVMNDLRVTTASEGFRIPQRGILQDFRPEVLPSTASFAMVLLFLEVGVAKMGFYVVGSAVPFLELMANCSYKFVPVTMMVLARTCRKLPSPSAPSGSPQSLSHEHARERWLVGEVSCREVYCMSRDLS